MIRIINATNLLGDSIYAINAIKEFLQRTEEPTLIVADPGLPYQMYTMTFNTEVFPSVDAAIAYKQERFKDEGFIITSLNAGKAGEICFTHARDTHRQPYITEGYAEILGFKYEGQLKPDVPWVDFHPKTHNIIGVSPFSRSCSRHSGEIPNKTLDDWKWRHLIGNLRNQQVPIKVFGAPTDRLQDVAVTEDEYLSARTFNDLCRELRRCKVFVTVDNGLCHLASVLEVPTIILWPAVSCLQFIAPAWQPKTTRFLMIGDPNKAHPAQILTRMRVDVREIME